MKKIFFEFLKIFTASTARIESNWISFRPVDEVWASFRFDEKGITLTNRPSNPIYNTFKAIHFGLLKERELLQLEQLLRKAAEKEERVIYEDALLSCANHTRSFWHNNFYSKTPEYQIEKLSLELKFANETIRDLKNRVKDLIAQIDAVHAFEECED